MASGRTQAVMTAIRERVSRQMLAPGEKLPSIRQLAREMQLSPSTVVEAYDRLAADGLIRARAGAGFFVVGAAAPVARADVAPRLDRAIDPLWVSRQSLDAGPDMASPGCGWLPTSWMPEAAIRRSIRALAGAEAAVLADYGAPRGSLDLRRLLVRQLAGEGLEVGTEQVLLTASGTQGIDLLFRFLLNPGDTVLVDDPCYFNFRALLRIHRAEVIGVPYTPTGPDVARFTEALATHRPRLYITNSALHNPTGATISPQTAHRILTAAAAHDVTIVEDEIFADFEPEPSPRLAALDGLTRVIRVGSFSKTLSAAIRCGYIVARPDWVEGLVDLQVATAFGAASPVAAALVLGTLGDGTYRKHVAGLRDRLAKRRRKALTQLEALGIKAWTIPRGGFYLWCRLPDGRNAAEVAKAALREGVVLAPGNVFSTSQTADDLMRFNAAQMSPDALRVLASVLSG